MVITLDRGVAAHCPVPFEEAHRLSTLTALIFEESDRLGTSILESNLGKLVVSINFHALTALKAWDVGRNLGGHIRVIEAYIAPIRLLAEGKSGFRHAIIRLNLLEGKVVANPAFTIKF